MTVEATTCRVQYYGNGSSREFPVPFPLLAEQDLQLILVGTDGIESCILSDYSISGTGTENIVVHYPLTGSPLGFGYTLTLVRLVPLKQELDLENGGPFNADDIEAAFDHTVMQIQQIQEQVDRSIKVSIASSQNPDALRDDLLSARATCENSAASCAVDAERAEASADSAAASAARASEIMHLSIAVDDAPQGEVASGTYNVESGMLTLFVPEGRQGAQGEQGIRGEQGVRGERGEQGERGVQGMRGERGERGERGGQGEQGEKGVKGDTGERGAQGSPGQSPRFDVLDCGFAATTHILTVDGGLSA